MIPGVLLAILTYAGAQVSEGGVQTFLYGMCTASVIWAIDSACHGDL